MKFSVSNPTVFRLRVARLSADKRQKMGTPDGNGRVIDYCGQCKCELHIGRVASFPLCKQCASQTDRPIGGTRNGTIQSEIQYHGDMWFWGEW